MNPPAGSPTSFLKSAFSLRAAIVILCTAGATPAPLRAQQASATPGAAPVHTDFSPRLCPDLRGRDLFRLRSPRDDPTAPHLLPADTYLSMRAFTFDPQPDRRSHFDRMLQGADRGMELGLFLGAAGTTAGVFDDHTAWWLAGTMAVLSAILGDTGSTTTRGPVHVQTDTAP